MAAVSPAPQPPIQMPPARTVNVPGHGEMFLRDTDPTRPTDPARPVVMLLHGWIASADLNWYGAYADLVKAGYRVLAVDHRGHRRGLRPLVPFRLADCAADAAATMRTLGVAPATVVGYSMGGAIAQLVARDHPDVVSGLVLSGTAQHWKEPQVRRVWRAMGAFGLMLSLSPRGTWRAGFRRVGLIESAGRHGFSPSCCATPPATSRRRGASSGGSIPARGCRPSSGCPQRSSSRRATRLSRRASSASWPRRWARRCSRPRSATSNLTQAGQVQPSTARGDRGSGFAVRREGCVAGRKAALWARARAPSGTLASECAAPGS